MIDKNFANKMLEVIHDAGYKPYHELYISSPRRHSNYYFKNERVNCSDHVNEEQLKVEYIKNVLMRKATPRELDYIKSQPKDDLNDGYHEDLKKAILYLYQLGVFNND